MRRVPKEKLDLQVSLDLSKVEFCAEEERA
jgi:hypothetical protein